MTIEGGSTDDKVLLNELIRVLGRYIHAVKTVIDGFTSFKAATISSTRIVWPFVVAKYSDTLNLTIDGLVLSLGKSSHSVAFCSAVVVKVLVKVELVLVIEVATDDLEK